MGRFSEKFRPGLRDPGRRAFLQAGFGGVGLLGMAGAAGQVVPKKGGPGKELPHNNPYCPVALVAQANGLYYYSTMQCKSPYAGSSMSSSERYTPGCQNTNTPPCQPRGILAPRVVVKYEVALQTDVRHVFDTEPDPNYPNKLDLPKNGMAKPLPIDEHFALTAGQGLLLGQEDDYEIPLDTGTIFVRTALILATPPPDPKGDPRPPVVIGIGQQLKGKPEGPLASGIEEIVTDPNTKKYLQLIRKKDLVCFHVVLVKD